jgi:hypothetical protein
MKLVSEGVQDVLTHLVAWECLGVTKFDPKILLRQIPLSDLSVISANIKKQGSALKEFVCVSMVGLEVLYKTGMLVGDWSYVRNDKKVSLTYEPVNFPKAHANLELLAIGAEA